MTVTVTHTQSPDAVLRELDPWLHRMTSRYVSDLSIHDDVVQEARVAVFKAFGTYREDSGTPFDYYVRRRVEWTVRTTVSTRRWTTAESNDTTKFEQRTKNGKETAKDKILAYHRAHPEKSFSAISRELGVALSTVSYHINRTKTIDFNSEPIQEVYVIDKPTEDGSQGFDVRDTVDVETLVLSNVFVSRVRAVIASLPPVQRLTVVGRIEGDSWSQIASDTGKSVTQVRYAWKQAREALEPLLAA